MTRGYLHAVEVTFLSAEKCVLYDLGSCLMSILLEAMTQDAIMNSTNKLHPP